MGKHAGKQAKARNRRARLATKGKGALVVLKNAFGISANDIPTKFKKIARKKIEKENFWKLGQHYHT